MLSPGTVFNALVDSHTFQKYLSFTTTRDELIGGARLEKGTVFTLHEEGANRLNSNNSLFNDFREGDRLTFPMWTDTDGKGRNGERIMVYFDENDEYKGALQIPGNVDLFSEMILPGKERKIASNLNSHAVS